MTWKAVWGTALIFIFNLPAPGLASEDQSLLAPRVEVVASPATHASNRTLNVLYGSYAALQVLDVTSTVAALNSGAREVNPIVASTHGQIATFVLLKAGTGAAVIALNRSLGKRNKTAAIVTMVALNVATAAVVAHNMRNARR
jgi:hypothetical protein